MDDGVLGAMDYLNETFSDEDSKVQPFQSIRDLRPLRISDIVSMNTPSKSLCEGVYQGTSIGRMPSNEPSCPYEYFYLDI